MTKKDFFILFIKLVSLYSGITTIFNSISFFAQGAGLDHMLSLAIIVVALTGALILVMFIAPKVVKILRLDRGFDDDRIDFNALKSIDLLRLGIIIIGGLLFVENFGRSISYAIFAFKHDNLRIEYTTDDKVRWLLCALNLLISILLLTNYNAIAKKMLGKGNGLVDGDVNR